MGHHISAIIAQDQVDHEQIQAYGLAAAFEEGYVILLLDIYAMGALAEILQKSIESSSQNLDWDCALTHFLAHKLGFSHYVLIQTDYFGGIGEQFASYFQAGQCQLKEVSINEALRKLGVAKLEGKDEFDSIHLCDYRSTDCYYWEEGNAAHEKDNMIAGRILKD